MYFKACKDKTIKNNKEIGRLDIEKDEISQLIKYESQLTFNYFARIQSESFDLANEKEMYNLNQQISDVEYEIKNISKDIQIIDLNCNQLRQEVRKGATTFANTDRSDMSYLYQSCETSALHSTTHEYVFKDKKDNEFIGDIKIGRKHSQKNKKNLKKRLREREVEVFHTSDLYASSKLNTTNSKSSQLISRISEENHMAESFCSKAQLDETELG